MSDTQLNFVLIVRPTNRNFHLSFIVAVQWVRVRGSIDQTNRSYYVLVCSRVCGVWCVRLFARVFLAMSYREKAATEKPLTDQFHPGDPHRSKY